MKVKDLNENPALNKGAVISRFDSEVFVPPFRLGRKQKRAILDARGREVIIMPHNNEKQAQMYCDYLNGTTTEPALNKTDVSGSCFSNQSKMKLVKTTEKEPKEETWYLVRCPEYSESGWEIAQWIDGEWHHGHMAQSCHKYVISYHPVPLEDMYHDR